MIISITIIIIMIMSTMIMFIIIMFLMIIMTMIQAGLRTLHEAGPELQRTISTDLEVVFSSCSISFGQTRALKYNLHRP